MPKIEAREVKYPELVAFWAVGENALTPIQAMGLMGWSPEGGDEKYGEDYFLKDMNGVKVRCLNNLRNRPFDEGRALAYAQDMLNGNWECNGEAMIVGEYGSVISLQHRGVGLILASQMVENDETGRWRKRWPKGISIETLIVYGVKETTAVIRTVDNVKSRSFADVLYTEGWFKKVGDNSRALACRIADVAVKQLWARTGAKVDIYSPIRTHSEALDFMTRHPTLEKIIIRLMGENQRNALGKYVRIGQASALMYLMAASGTTPGGVKKYRDAQTPRERMLDLELFEMAANFWAILIGPDPSFQPLREALARQADPITGAPGSLIVTTALIAKAWGLYRAKKDFTDANLELETRADTNGISRLIDPPTFGGIDVGDNIKAKTSDQELPEGEPEPEEHDPTPEEIQERAEAIKAENGHTPALEGGEHPLKARKPRRKAG
jgi:hypothetical protein